MTEQSMIQKRRQLPMDECRTLAEGAIAEHGGELVLWATTLDNYEPPRRHAGNYAVVYARKVSGIPGFKFWPSPEMLHADKAWYLLDNGNTVTPYYVAGWQNLHDPDRWLVLEPVPAGVAMFMEKHWNPTSAAQGPRMTYYLVVRPAPPAEAAPRRSYADVVCDTINGNLRD